LAYGLDRAGAVGARDEAGDCVERVAWVVRYDEEVAEVEGDGVDAD